MTDYTETQNYLELAVQSNDQWFKDRALQRAATELSAARDENKTLREGMERVNANAEKHEREMYLAQDEAERLRGRVAELEEGIKKALESPFGYQGQVIRRLLSDELEKDHDQN